MNSRFKEKYEKEIVPLLSKELGIDNKMALPKISKVIVNMGIGDTLKNKELVENSAKDLASITGQKPQMRLAKVSVASFGIRRGMLVGLKVTLRKEKMYAFLDKLFSVTLPRLRDFRGLSVDSFDAHGNYTLGLTENSIFPEIDTAKSQIRGLEVTIVTNTDNKEVSKRLLELMGTPFEKVSAENKGQRTKEKN
ncbi:MAG: 50S ribosomal protein L5 [Candidatus Woesebacteria bacterium GW2011_GWA1_39_12]|uniref:Large ribosomal subunit protein uL5 n=2 Tax=Candidatus Woeseibacteriota TaxID=1752722 RepID=A0A0G0PIF6_9BACT|nr:MAG: 50S ribosomal protein L5 [Candidatus Woesebacteria bacterium GW2011_GWA1_39_12]